MVNEKRRHRRRSYLERRRSRQFIELLRSQEDDAIDGRESRGHETAPTRVTTVLDGVGIQDEIDVSTRTESNAQAVYGDPDRGYGLTYASIY